MTWDSRTDPEQYQDAEDVVGVESDILRSAFESARVTYATCGGHWRAHRMEVAMKVIAAEMEERGEPVAERCSACGSAVKHHVDYVREKGVCVV